MNLEFNLINSNSVTNDEKKKFAIQILEPRCSGLRIDERIDLNFKIKHTGYIILAIP